MEIVKNIENKLLSRKEIEAVIEKDGATLSRATLRKELAKKLKVDEKLVIINKAQNVYGSNKIQVIAKIYADEASLVKNARPHMVKRNTTAVAAEEA